MDIESIVVNVCMHAVCISWISIILHPLASHPTIVHLSQWLCCLYEFHDASATE